MPGKGIGLETEAKWIRWNELAERWRWASITGEEPPAAAKGHGRVPTLVKRDLRPHEAKLVFSDLDFCELSLVTATRRLEHLVGILDRHGMNGLEAGPRAPAESGQGPLEEVWKMREVEGED